MAEIARASRLGLVAVAGEEKVVPAAERRPVLRVAEDGVLLASGRHVEPGRLLFFVDEREYESVLVRFVLIRRVPFGAREAAEDAARVGLDHGQRVADVVTSGVEARRREAVLSTRVDETPTVVDRELAHLEQEVRLCRRDDFRVERVNHYQVEQAVYVVIFGLVFEFFVVDVVRQFVSV